ncbi:conserved protein, unknown function [Hepatocystis sp. ex Piliocolobus tephrosceles]|nr:conserved protein, unknown function [Hepatocystis sp. ex Piliocolobus tephrosceles]
MSYGWLTEGTLFGKKEKIIELNKDKLFNESKDNKKSENSIDQLNSIVNSYLQNIKENKKNQLGKKKVSYQEKLYNAKNEGVEKRIKKDKKDALSNKKVSKSKKYEEMQKKRQMMLSLIDLESKKEAEKKLEEIRTLKKEKMAEKKNC